MKTLLATALLTLALPALPVLPILGEGQADAAPLRSQNGTYELQVLTNGAPAQTYWHSGESYVLGYSGERYTLRIVNNSGQRIEAVVSVDGRDVVDGKAADYRTKRGYLVPAYGSVEVDGWRLSRGQAAAFRFSSVGESYAARTGSAREVGVIGVAVFPERYNPPPRPLYVPRYDYRRGDDYYGPLGGAADKAKDEAEYSGGAAGPPPPADSAPRSAAPSPPAGESVAQSKKAARGDSALAEPDYSQRSSRRPGLGTAFGERVNSPIQEVSFVRASATSPAAVLGVRYNDRDGLLAMGVNVDGDGSSVDDSYARRTAQPFPVPERRYATPPPGWDYRY
jgi:hypothetical protein